MNFNIEIGFGLLILFYLAEGYHDSIIERIQNFGEKKLIETWHKTDALFHLFLNISLAYWVYGITFKGVVLGITLLGLRQIFMVIPLNLFRGRKPFYIGSTAKFDQIFNKIGWLVFLAAAIIIVTGYLILKGIIWN